MWKPSIIGNVMLVTLEYDNTTGSFYVIYYVISMTTVSDCMCTRVYLYTIIIHTDDMTRDMCHVCY